MFTGIIEGVGEVVELRKTAGYLRLSVRMPDSITGINIGDSISVDGVCLTVVDVDGEEAVFEVVSVTLETTTLSVLKKGTKVNLERAVRLGGRLSGHLITGHIDGVGRIARRKDGRNVSLLEIAVPEECMRYIVPKGSVALDGISLTVSAIGENSLSINIIPETLRITTLKWKTAGDRVNVETDILGKYVQKFISMPGEQKKRNDISREFLAEHGFI